MPPRFNWQLAASRAIQQEDGSVWLESTMRRNGLFVATFVLRGSANVAKASDLQPWWHPNGEDG